MLSTKNRRARPTRRHSLLLALALLAVPSTTDAAPLSRDMLMGYAVAWLKAVYDASPRRTNCIGAETEEAHLTYIFRCGRQFWAARSTTGEDVRLIPLEAEAAQTARLYGSAGQKTFAVLGSLGASEKARLLSMAKRLSF